MFFEAKTVTPETIRDEVKAFADGGWRLVTLSQTVVDENTLALYYHFDKNLTMSHLRMEVNKDTPIPSISDIYFCALLIENETQDQFGVTFDGLILDYKGALYLEGEVTRAPYFTMTTAKKAAANAQAQAGAGAGATKDAKGADA